ncbi:MAG: hypothetical protein LUH05_05695, partial [Candidatus Gastranaerophilales bacterium]|nr:hypothetical protein [Candidatus Gastranaerophilales bacterium]
YFLKIFDKKRYFTFILSFLMLFSLLFMIIYYEKQKLGNDMVYELHNTSLLASHIPDYLNKITEEEKAVILNIYSESNGILDYNDLSKKDNAKYATIIILKTVFKHSPYLIKEGFNRYKNYNGGAIFQEDENLFFNYKYKPIPTKIIDYLTLPSSNYFVVWNKIMSNPTIYYVLLGIFFILGFIYKNYFYVWFCLTFLFLHSLLLLIVPFYAYFYIYPCYIALYWIFILFILDIIKLKNK